MRRWIYGAIVVVLLLYVAVCVVVFLLQRSLIYFPQPRQVRDEASTLKLPVDGAELVVTVRPRPGPKAILYFGGNAEDVSANLDTFSAWFPDHSLYLMHYRGFGGSTGAPSEAANHADAAALWRAASAQHTELVVIGRSLGSGIAVRLAATRPIAKLILVTPYDSVAEIAARAYWFLPTRWMLLDRYDSGRYAPSIRVPTTVLVAQHDAEIPRDSTDKLIARFAPGIVRRIDIPGSDHNSILGQSGYRAALQSGV